MVAAACVAVSLTTLLLFSPVLVISPGKAAALLLITGTLALWRGGIRALLLSFLAGLPVVAAVGAASNLLAQRWPDLPGPGDTVISGSICEFPRQQPGSWRFVLTTDAESRARAVPPKLLVSWYDSGTRTAAMPQPGQRWQLRVRLRAPRGLSNPGGFDYERWLFAGHVGATGWVREAADNRRLPDDAVTCPAAGWRAAIAWRIKAALNGREAAPYVLGLAIGAYQALPEAEWDKLRRTGTIHLISISGFHIALVAGPAALLGLALGRTCLAAGPRCRPRVLAAWAAMVAAVLYGALAGFSVPTARSVIAVGVVAILASRRRAITAAELLAAVVLGVLLVEPLAPLVPGFWLSFAGVVVLAAVAVGLGRVRGSARPVRLLVGTQVGMTLGLAPLLVVCFGQLPLAGTLANLVAVPAFSLMLLPLSLLGAVAVLVAPQAGAAILGVAADGFDLWSTFLGWCAGLPLAVWHLPEPAPLGILVAGAGVVSALWPPPWPGRWLGLGMLAGLLVAARAPVPPGGLRVTVLDVGQGLAVLVQTSGRALLYDTGPAFRTGDAGQRVVVPALQALNVGRLDTLLISHPDADHRGGALSVLQRYPLAPVLGSGIPGIPSTPCKAGSRWRWNGILFEVLHPAAGAASPGDNEGSCVLRVEGAGVRFLLTGDIEARTEYELVSQPDFLPADVVVAPHHGSRTSSTAGLVEATRPRYVIFSSGFRNRWNFPHTEVVERWRRSGACVLNTADEGALQLEVTPDSSLRLVHRQRLSAPGVWLVRPAVARPCG